MNKEDIYNVSSYTDEELYGLLDLNNPSDRELEAKIISMIQKYNNIPNDTGNKLAIFFTDIYNHFFDHQNEDNDNDNNNNNNNTNITENFENINVDPTSQTQKMIVATTNLSQEENTNNNEPGKSVQATTGTKEIGFIKPLDFAPDKLNPLLTQTIKRIISVDSQYRDDKTSMTTSFSFNLSTPLKDVVSLKLYSVQIPFTWYTISKSYGSNFFYLKGNKPGILNNPSQDIFFDISAGNYSAQDLVIAVNDSIFGNVTKNKVGKSEIYPDVSFGKTNASYDNNTSLANLNFDIKKQFNENSYYLQFENITSSNRDKEVRIDSIPAFLGFNYQTYDLNTIKSDLLPFYGDTTLSSLDSLEYFTIDDNNKSFSIFQYVGNYNTTTGTVDDYSGTKIYEIKITLSLISGTNYSRNTIFNEVSNQLSACPYLSKESYIKRTNIIDPNVKGYGNSQFHLKIKLDRYTTQNVTNSKCCIKWPVEENTQAYTIWSGSASCFNFVLQKDRNDNVVELNRIVGETESVSQTINYKIDGNPQILLTCSSEHFVSPLNDIQISIKSSENQDYLITEYMNEINKGIIESNINTPFLNGPSTTDAVTKYPDHTYAYIDSKDRFNLQVKVQKIFDKNMYRLDLTNSYLYETFKLGNTDNGNIVVTENDTLGVKGFINKNKLTITSNNTIMPKVDLRAVDVKISFDVSFSTYGNSLPYGNIYLSKSDTNYLDSGINNNWTINGSTFVVTEETFFITSDKFLVNDRNIQVKSIDISSNQFSIAGNNLSLVNSSITLPIDVSTVYFDNNDYKIHFSDNVPVINGNSWKINGNTWTIDASDNWNVKGNTFVNNVTNWQIVDQSFDLSKYQSSRKIDTIDLSGTLLMLMGNKFNITSTSNTTLDINYQNNNNGYNDISFNINCTEYTYFDNQYSFNSNYITTDSTTAKPIFCDTVGINAFNNTMQAVGSNLTITGNNFIVTGTSGYAFDASCTSLTRTSTTNYEMISDWYNYSNTGLTINNGNIQLANNIEMIGNLMLINSNDSIIIDNPVKFKLTGSKLSVSSGGTKNYFEMEGNKLTVTSKQFTLKNDLYDSISTFGIDINTAETVLLRGYTINISGTDWDISGDVINYTNNILNTDYSFVNNSCLITGNVKVKGNNFLLPRSYPIIQFDDVKQIFTFTTKGFAKTGTLDIVSTPSESILNGMQIDVSFATIYSTNNTYIVAVNDVNGQDSGNGFRIDISNILLENKLGSNRLIFRASSLQHGSLSKENPINFTYAPIWLLKGTFLKLGTQPNFQITLPGTTDITNDVGSTIVNFNNQIVGNLYISTNKIHFNDVEYEYSGIISSITGQNMTLTTSSEPFTVTIGSFVIRGNTFICPPSIGGSSEGIVYLNPNNNFTFVGNTLTAPNENILSVTATNLSLNYNLDASNIFLEGNNLCINDRIGSINCDIQYPIEVKSINNITASNMAYIIGSKDLILGTITSGTYGNILNIKKDKESYLFGLLPILPDSNYIGSNLSISGSLLDLTNQSLSIAGNNVKINNNNAPFTTRLTAPNYEMNKIKVSSTSFHIENNDSLSNCILYGNTFAAIEQTKWKLQGNLLTVAPKINDNNDWTFRGTNITVYDNSFQIIDTSLNLSGANFKIPGNLLKVNGNTMNLTGNTFTTSSNTIEMNTIIDYVFDSKIYNIYSEYYNNPINTISYDQSTQNGQWKPSSTSGFDTSVTLMNYNNENTFVTGDNLLIKSKGSNNYTITTTSLLLSVSADILKTTNANNKISYTGKKYSSETKIIDLGTPQIPYDFSINVVYNSNYLPLTQLVSNTLISSSYVIPKNALLFTIYPRFDNSILVFGNENDVSYNITNNTNNALVSTSITELTFNITSLIESFQDTNGERILSGSSITLNKNKIKQKEVTLDCSLNIVVNKVLNRKDYAVNFVNYKDENGVTYETWKPNLNVDPLMVDVSYSLINSSNSPNISINDVLNKTIIKGSKPLETIGITLNNNNNNVTFVAYENGTVANDITITIPTYSSNGTLISYSRNSLINAINNLLSTTIAKGTKFITNTNSSLETYVTIRPNINLIYTSKDYKVVFYDTISFVKCFVGSSSIKNTTWDTTIGWILGFRNSSEYDLSEYSAGPNGTSIIGDTGVCTNLFNYFLLCIDDFTQNHINDGLISISPSETSIPLPSYADRSNFVCNPTTNTLTYNNAPVENSKLTQKQLYSLTELANSQSSTSSNLTKGVSYSSFGKGPYVQDIFGLIPMKTSGLPAGSSYIEFGGTLQNQERIYFGPVNIHRMSVKLVTDRGDVVDLNSVNWSFSLLCEQLYKKDSSSKK